MKTTCTCPNCDSEFTVTVTVKGVIKKEKPKIKSATGDIWSIVQHYLDVKGITDKVQVEAQKGRLCKAAKQYLMNTGSDVELIKSKITSAKPYFEGQGISWTIETVGKYWSNVDEKVQVKGW